VLSLGENHACGIESQTRRLYCWGSNAEGQLGLGDENPRLTPTLVPTSAPVAALATGYQHTCAVLGDGSLWCWGNNTEGQLGQGDDASDAAASSPVPLRVGTEVDWQAVAGGQAHTCAIRSGMLFCWGRNVNSELGLGPGQPLEIRAPAQVGPDTGWVEIRTGQDDACALRQDGTLFCWGDNSSGQGGQSPAVSTLVAPSQVGTDADWVHVGLETFSGCALKMDSSLWCWGRNAEGQLGVGDNVDRAAPSQVSGGVLWQGVTVGRFFTCAEAVDGHFACTGANDSGQLGQGDTVRRNVLTTVPVPGAP
jgi:alpha-tubulin suppressor-like RCC1 family protein